jgi:hypothetical protein
MNKNLAITLFTVGLLLCFGGAGGVEHSADALSLLGSVVLSGIGLLTMWLGTEGLKEHM